MAGKQTPGADRPRIRRTPDEARAHLLDAAARLFASYTPDEIGLKEVAREAGVSHALVTHYFGTYDGLVEATLARAMASLRERVLGVLAAGPADGTGLEALFAGLRDGATARLITWSVLSGRARRPDFFAAQRRGLSLIAHAIVARAAAAGLDIPIARAEFAVAAAFAAALGFTALRDPLSASLGDPPKLEWPHIPGELMLMLRAYMLAPA